MKFLIDTNILIYFFNGGLELETHDRIDAVLEKSFRISGITRIDFLGWKKLTGNTAILADQFLKSAKVYRMDEKSKDIAIRIRKDHATPIPDAIIADTALQHGFTLVTRNTDDFSAIPGLSVYNPFLQ